MNFTNEELLEKFPYDFIYEDRIINFTYNTSIRRWIVTKDFDFENRLSIPEKRGLLIISFLKWLKGEK